MGPHAWYNLESGWVCHIQRWKSLNDFDQDHGIDFFLSHQKFKIKRLLMCTFEWLTEEERRQGPRRVSIPEKERLSKWL
jgi:hypothetical protein